MNTHIAAVTAAQKQQSPAEADGFHFLMHTGERVFIPHERPQTPPRAHGLREAFRTPSPRSVPMERTPPSPYRKLCLDCAERARDFYNRAHADHATMQAMQRYTNVYDAPVPQRPPSLHASQVNVLNSIISRPPTPPIDVKGKGRAAEPLLDSADARSWPDPYDGVA